MIINEPPGDEPPGDEPPGDDRPSIYSRDARVVRAVMDTLMRSPKRQLRWIVVIDLVSSRFPLKKPRTFENVIYDLIVFGALQKAGQHDRRADGRVLWVTPLGAAWWQRTVAEMVDEPEELGPR